MTLGIHLLKADVQWCIDIVHLKEESRVNPGRFHLVPRLRIRLADMALAASSGQPPVTLETFLSPHDSGIELENSLARAMREHLPEHPVFKTWLRERGNELVRIETENLQESLGECLHTALRKAVDGSMSCIQHRAIQHLAGGDWSALLQSAREEIGMLIEQVQTGRAIALNRREVGLAIKKAFCDAKDKVRRRLEPGSSLPVKRNPVEDFAFMSLTMACRETRDQDYVWGWTAYLCTELTPDEEAVARASQEARYHTYQEHQANQVNQVNQVHGDEAPDLSIKAAEKSAPKKTASLA